MGKDSRSKDLARVSDTAGRAYSNLTSGPTPLEQEMVPQSQQMWNNYMTGAGRNMEDYGNIMSGYRNFASNLPAATKFTPRTVSAGSVGVSRPEELTKAYGYLNQAAPGYTEFSQTGGYSPTDIQELRARGTSPIRSAYSNAMMEMNRARSLGGNAGAPNYIAALSRMQRELPGQLADATTTVNAQLADAIRQGKLSGLAGLTGIGGEMGGLASAESGRQLQAGIANTSNALQAELANARNELEAQGMDESSIQNRLQAMMASLSGQTGLYGTTPAMASTFGNQALSGYGQRAGLEQMRNQFGLGLLDAQLRGYGGQTAQPPLWKQIVGGVGDVVGSVF